ncbi:MAG: hypothetical protein ACXWX7_10260 [Candidatus Binatia bacterium]
MKKPGVLERWSNGPAEEHRALLAEIAELKKSKNAYILVHHYAPPVVVHPECGCISACAC